MPKPGYPRPMPDRLVIFVDVDDTLVRSFGSKRIPMTHVADHVRALHESEAELYCWSSGGGEYARRSAEELGLADAFAGFLPKPNVFLDDVAPRDWPRCILQHPSGVRTLGPGEYRAKTEPGARAHGTVSLPVIRFAESAREFVRLVNNAARLSTRDLVSSMTAALADLYANGLLLPEVDAPESPEEPEVQQPSDWPGFGERDMYLEVFDPYVEDAPVRGSLSDDVLDIYRDVRAGLDLLDDGHVDGAVWHWRFTLRIHWGAHAVDAMRALQRLLTEL